MSIIDKNQGGLIDKSKKNKKDISLIQQLWRNIADDRLTLFFFFVLLAVIVISILARFIAPFSPVDQSLLRINEGPSATYLLGTDQYGRDVYSRIVFGSRTSLILGVLSPVLAALIGVTVGLVGGYFGGWIDRIAGRIIDILLAFPALLLGILVAAVLSSGFWSMVAVLVIAFAPRFARIARASTLALRSEPFIDAAIAAGVSHFYIILRHILPNVAGSIVVVLTLWIATAIRLEATLSFLGLGTQPPEPSWGNIIRDGLHNMTASPWPVIGAGFAISLTVLAFNMIGDSIRDVLDPEARV
jgi:peptide/nickel transport system permease protein